MRERAQQKDFVDNSGRIHEYDLFGEIPKDDPEYLRALKAVGPDTAGYLTYGKALELVKKFQREDPVNPRKKFANALRLGIIDEMQRATPEEMDRVRFYTAVGSALDHFHGIDAFIEVTDAENNIARVTFDASINKNKTEDAIKADMLVGELPDLEDDPKRYWKEIERLSKQAVEILKTQLEAFKHRAYQRES